ncbi:MAG: TIGR01212 family radical SAM protein [Sulfurimonadaceae bacterium]
MAYLNTKACCHMPKETLPYYAYSDYMRRKYGEPLFRVPIDLELGCPNRRPDGSGGCTFCPENGARAVQTLDVKGSEAQLEAGIAFAKKRYKARRFMLYIQAYTGTFTSVIGQKRRYSELLSAHPFDAISIGTRPDCLSKATLSYLKELDETLDVYVELGVQTIHDETLVRINREHDWQSSLDAIAALKSHGIKVCAHIIVGLPGEGREHYIQTAKALAALDLDGIKIHNLHVIKNTRLADEYLAKPFPVMSEYEYAEVLIEIIRHLPPGLPLMRFATDTPDEEIVAPKWHMIKGQFSEYVTEQMNHRRYRQGDLFEAGNEAPERPAPKVFECQDGSYTIWNKAFRDHYHPTSGARVQANELFLAEALLKERLAKGPVRLLDIGFGMGYNSLLACEEAESTALHALEIHAIDQDRGIIADSAGVIKNIPGEKLAWPLILQEIYESGTYISKHCSVTLHYGDVRHALNEQKGEFDIIFLDPFIERSNCKMVTIELFEHLTKLLKADGLLVCSSIHAATLSAMAKAGFCLTTAGRPQSDIQGIVAKHMGSFPVGGDVLPYHDPHGVWTDRKIRQHREKEIERQKS